MSCCEKEKIKRLKDINHAKVLACQNANLTRRVLAVVKLNHHQYGDYYDGIDYEEARDKEYKVLKKYSTGDTMAVSKGN